MALHCSIVGVKKPGDGPAEMGPVQLAQDAEKLSLLGSTPPTPLYLPKDKKSDNPQHG